MKAATLKMENGNLIESNSRTVQQSRLSAECWSIQVWGKETCETCGFKNRKECGGKNIRKTGKNDKGITVPI